MDTEKVLWNSGLVKVMLIIFNRPIPVDRSRGNGQARRSEKPSNDWGGPVIEGAGRRIPGGPHWELYRQAERDHPDLIVSLAKEIRSYATGKDELNSTTAGREILPRWSRRDEYNRLFASTGSELFGMVAWVALFDDSTTWRTTREEVEGRDVRVYRRVA